MADTVLITGCSRGIGRATAGAFLDEGWTVYATARTPDDLADLADRGCLTAALDVTDGDQVEAVVERTVEEAGGIDCLVNNAGIVTVAAVEEQSSDEFREQFDVNLFGPHRTIRAVVPHMRERGSGTVVNVGSVAGRFPVPLEGSYSASKFALRALSDALRDELRTFGVDVVLVEPPFVRTRQAETETGADEGREGSPYAFLYERFVAHARKELASAVEPDAVADRVLAAATADSPRPYYPVGLSARFQSLLGLLPPGIRYRLWWWNAGR